MPLPDVTQMCIHYYLHNIGWHWRFYENILHELRMHMPRAMVSGMYILNSCSISSYNLQCQTSNVRRPSLNPRLGLSYFHPHQAQSITFGAWSLQNTTQLKLSTGTQISLNHSLNDLRGFWVLWYACRYLDLLHSFIKNTQRFALKLFNTKITNTKEKPSTINRYFLQTRVLLRTKRILILVPIMQS